MQQQVAEAEGPRQPRAEQPADAAGGAQPVRRDEPGKGASGARASAGQDLLRRVVLQVDSAGADGAGAG